MRIYIDLDTDQIITSPGIPQAITGLEFKRANSARIDVQFVKAGQIMELQDGTNGIFELKAQGKYDAAPVTGSTGWSKVGTGTGTYYSFSFTLITNELDLLLLVNVDPADDLSSIKLMGEIQWTDPDGASHTTQTVLVTVDNNVIRTGDIIPGGGVPNDYMIDDTDPANPTFVVDETTLVAMTAG